MCVVEQYLKPAILAKIDENQFGAISNSNTVTDGNGSTNRIILFHFRKAYFLFSVFKCLFIDILLFCSFHRGINKCTLRNFVPT